MLPLAFPRSFDGTLGLLEASLVVDTIHDSVAAFFGGDAASVSA